MDTKEFLGLVEAYAEVYAPQEEIEEVEQIDEAEGSYGQTPKATAAYGKLSTARRSKPATEYSQKGEKTKKVKSAEKHFSSSMRTAADHRGKQSTPPSRMVGRGKMNQDSRDWARESDVEYGAGENKPGSGTVTKNPKKLRKQKALGEIGEGYDIFDVVLEFLQVEGFAETLEEAEWMMANMIDEEAIEIILGEEQLDEISQKTATKAYAQSATGEFEGADSERDVKRTDNLRRHIQRKFGDKAAEDADKHADATTFGRKDPRTGKRQQSPKPRIEKNRTYRTTKAGKMHGQDQSKLKRDLEYKRSSRTEEFVGEAQEARNNPEKYEREQSKKYAPVRGEKTPMPPRGDKRREDFEKWYAKQMSR